MHHHPNQTAVSTLPPPSLTCAIHPSLSKTLYLLLKPFLLTNMPEEGVRADKSITDSSGTATRSTCCTIAC